MVKRKILIYFFFFKFTKYKKEKTKGNLSEELEKTQEMMLSELRRNFLDETNKQV